MFASSMPLLLLSTSCLLFKDASVVVDVIPDEPPSVEILSPTSEDVLFDEVLIPLWVSVSDMENLPTDLTVEWYSDLDGVLGVTGQDWLPNEQGDSFGRTTLSVGVHVLTVTVSDPEGVSTTEDVQVSVQGTNSNVAPTCELLSPFDGTIVSVGANVEFRGTANDQNSLDENLNVEWQSSIDGVLGVSSPTDQGDVFYSMSFDSVNTHLITMLVTDNMGESCFDDVQIHVANGPTVEILQPYDDIVIVPYSNTVFEGLITHDEVDVSTLSVRWVSDVDGELVSGNPSSYGEAIWVGDFETYGPHQVALETEDDNGLIASDSVNIFYNAIPKISEVVVEPLMPSSTDVLTCIPTYNDDDDGALNVFYNWSVPRTGQNIQATTANNFKSTLDLQSVVLGESATIECSVSVEDEHGYMVEMSTSVMLSNQ